MRRAVRHPYLIAFRFVIQAQPPLPFSTKLLLHLDSSIDRKLIGRVLAEQAAGKIKEAAGVGKQKADGAAAEAKGKANEVAGEAKGKAHEVAGKAKGAAEEAKGKL